MALNFEKYAIEARQFLEDLAFALGDVEDTDKAARILRAVLHTIRDRVIIQESLQFIAQLPMFLKAVYVENWKYQEKRSNFRSLSEFLETMVRQDYPAGQADFTNEMEALNAFKIVLNQLEKYISKGEMQDILAEMPKNIRTIVAN